MKGDFFNRNADSFKAYFAGRFLSQFGSGRVLLLGALVLALAVSVGLALAVPTKEARAQETVTLHEGTITVGQSQISDDVVGYSDFKGTVEKDFSVESVFGSIDADSFKYVGTTYKIQRIFLNKRFDALVVKIDPLLNDGTQDGPNVIIGDETYSVQDSMLELEYYSWLYVELDWQEGDTVGFTFSITPGVTTDVGTQSSAGVDFATMFGVAVQAPDSWVRASAQSGMPVHEATITLAQDPDSKYFYGFSDYVGPLHGLEEVESIYGSITDPTFEHEGTGYEIQRLFYNWALNVLYIKIDPLFEGSSNIRPTLTLGDQTYDGEDTFLGIQHYIWWEDIVPLEWEIGDSVPLTLALSTVSSSDTQSSSDPDLVSALNSLTGREGGEGSEEEGGGLSGWMGWVGAVAAVVVASIGYTAYRVLR